MHEMKNLSIGTMVEWKNKIYEIIQPIDHDDEYLCICYLNNDKRYIWYRDIKLHKPSKILDKLLKVIYKNDIIKDNGFRPIIDDEDDEDLFEGDDWE